MYYVYIIKSRIKDKIYIGSTNNLKRRFSEHNRGGEQSTKSFRPWKLFYYEAYGDESLARLREKGLKNNGNAIKELKKRIGLVKSGAGFTLIEMLIVIGIILVVAGLSIPFLFSYQTSSNITAYSNNIERTLRRAQLQAVNGYESDGWGVYFDKAQKKFIIFKGVDYFNRDVDYDQETSYPETLNITSTFGDEVYFSVYTGAPSVTGTITASSTESFFSRQVIINELGIINVNQ